MTHTLANVRVRVTPCPSCNGTGSRRVALADLRCLDGKRTVLLPCRGCAGRGYNKEALDKRRET